MGKEGGPSGKDMGLKPEVPPESKLRMRGVDAGTKLPEKTDYFREQLDRATLDKLLNLDLANNPRAELRLLMFLKDMGVSDEELKKSRVMEVMRGKHDIHERIKESLDTGEIADWISKVI